MNRTTRPMLHTGLALSPTWLRGGSWRRPDSRVEELFSIRFYADAARLAEQACVGFVFKPDSVAIDARALGHWPGFSGPDPTLMLAAVAGHTRRIGLVTTVSTTFAPPFEIARRLQSLHQLSDGRAGWNVVMSLDGQRLYGTDVMEDSSARYARAGEVVTVVRDLWRSYPSSAVLADRASGRYADPDRLRPVEHAGAHVRLAGLNTLPEHPAGHLPIFQAGGSPAGRDFAARLADAVFAMTPDIASGVELREDLRARAARHGRRPDDIRVLPGLSLFLAPTASAAADLVSQACAGAPRPDGARQGAAHWTVVGTPDDAVRAIARRAEAGALDGFIALPGGSWDSLRLFTHEVMPRLADAGVVPGRYTGTTLAEHLGIARG